MDRDCAPTSTYPSTPRSGVGIGLTLRLTLSLSLSLSLTLTLTVTLTVTLALALTLTLTLNKAYNVATHGYDTCLEPAIIGVHVAIEVRLRVPWRFEDIGVHPNPNPLTLTLILTWRLRCRGASRTWRRAYGTSTSRWAWAANPTLDS